MRHEAGSMMGAGGVHIYTQAWLPDAAPQAAIVLIHGLGEHSSRYAYMATRLTKDGFAVHAFDHRGHGQSGGRRVQVGRFSELTADVNSYVEAVRALYPSLPLFVIGHSMGGLVALGYVNEYTPQLTGLVISATAASPPPNTSGLTIAVGRALAGIAPNLGVAALPLEKVSRDPAVVAAYFADPLITRIKVRARMGSELIGAMKRVDAALPSITMPVLILHGADDAIAGADASRHIDSRIGSQDKQLIVYPKLWHEIFNEPERDQVIDDVRNWLQAHFARAPLSVGDAAGSGGR